MGFQFRDEGLGSRASRIVCLEDMQVNIGLYGVLQGICRGLCGGLNFLRN